MRQIQSFRIYKTSFIQRAPSAARRCDSLELGRIKLVGSTAPLSAKLAKTKRLISYGETAHDNAKCAAEVLPFQHHSGANLALRCSDNGFKSRLALRLIKAANATDPPFAKKLRAGNKHLDIGKKQTPPSGLPVNNFSASKVPLRPLGRLIQRLVK